MPMGVILDSPSEYSGYARVRDEYGQDYTVHGSEVAADAAPGDNFAYRVDLWQNSHGQVASLRAGTYGPR